MELVSKLKIHKQLCKKARGVLTYANYILFKVHNYGN